ncbi:unnamed protein product [Closterium sp. Yama58-4]|nr:unnamed protein product [Closterium sp. Yama58-4]
MAAERALSALSPWLTKAALAPVIEELAARKEEVNELRHMLAVAEERNEAAAAAIKERTRELAAKAELAEVKGELAKYKEKWAESSGASDVSGLGGKSRKRTHDMRSEFAGEEERTEVQELTACKDKHRIQYLKLNAELEISQAIESATKKNNSDLRFDHGLSDAVLHLMSTRTDLTGVNLPSALSFSAEGIKHLYRLPQLAELDLDGTVVSDSALEGIGSLTSLDSLFLHRAKGVTDAGMVHVGKLTGLEGLHLVGTAVTDDGLQQLTALTKLRSLWPAEGDFLVDIEVHWRIGRCREW